MVRTLFALVAITLLAGTANAQEDRSCEELAAERLVGAWEGTTFITLQSQPYQTVVWRDYELLGPGRIGYQQGSNTYIILTYSEGKRQSEVFDLEGNLLVPLSEDVVTQCVQYSGRNHFYLVEELLAGPDRAVQMRHEHHIGDGFAWEFLQVREPTAGNDYATIGSTHFGRPDWVEEIREASETCGVSGEMLQVTDGIVGLNPQAAPSDEEKDCLYNVLEKVGVPTDRAPEQMNGNALVSAATVLEKAAQAQPE